MKNLEQNRRNPTEYDGEMGSTSPLELIETISNARKDPTQAKRQERFEKRHPNRTARSYRGIPNDLHEWVVKLAEEFYIPIGEIVTLALMKLREAIENDELELKSQFTRKQTKFTIFPDKNDKK